MMGNLLPVSGHIKAPVQYTYRFSSLIYFHQQSHVTSNQPTSLHSIAREEDTHLPPTRPTFHDMYIEQGLMQDL